MSETERDLRDWPHEQTVYLTLDFECDFGTALSENRYGAVEHVDRLVNLLETHGVPLTTFVQTELLEVKPDVVETLQTSQTEVAFHPHSHTHRPRSESSIGTELTRSTERYVEFFGEQPTGYRFPNGNITPADYELLADHGYRFDASVFPSWRPNHFDNTDLPTRPHVLPDVGLVEIPFTVYADSVRIPTALSYVRVLGKPFAVLLERRPPRTLIFNVHMHDLVTPPSYSELSPLYKTIYARNDHGFELLDRFLRRSRQAGYAFETLDGLADSLQPNGTDYSR
ncbi:Peptidoglycan/xylan/chitin deacetylase, PgdA/CDA1 family [Halorhabdus sp. SVX81]|uniref:polysaccharide deacetylase family protein n=1 Tax=Halorhabdus sp. SVX81 TaxID=2978283 RepID=UPI0023DC4492|nr:polysaccharide deacetylase family protein [Halorhabdus sp. SVX81]WEL16730.1 Peptidoglycan/xylan/chitin deacetylase, PgdA/CDA1 family [Halorhabdus sp. SVX81]